ncbi:YaeQ family protein [Paludibacterium yongneupense]|uniref:YaeQ family protein n=1 Tax=Paludibacterium yongneupense TaxID=400061 RepID=UPI00048C6560|nr:YaeQ family protein [Paludibacterium yongneupense]
MALKATIYKADLTISDMDRGYYASHNLTVALHPSETVERMMLRLAVFARHASETMAFTKGISVDDEPDIWQLNYGGEIEHWIELGEPDEKRLRRACSRAEAVWVYSYGGRAGEMWWKQMEDKARRFSKLTVESVAPDILAQLATLCDRSMQLTVTIQDGQMWLADANTTVLFASEKLQPV